MISKENSLKRYSLFALVLVFCLTLSTVGRSFAQAPQAPGQPPAQPAPGQPPVQLGPTEESVSTTYREPKKDPFFDEKLLVKKAEEAPKKAKPIEVVAPPSFEEREALWKQRRDDARKNGRPEPSPSEKYLIEEMNIMGLYKKPDGSGVFMKPKTSNTTMIFATVGQKFWDGSIRRIEGNQIEVEVITKLSNNTTKSDSKTLRFTRGK